jgi:subtilisin family serine protease
LGELRKNLLYNAATGRLKASGGVPTEIMKNPKFLCVSALLTWLVAPFSAPAQPAEAVDVLIGFSGRPGASDEANVRREGGRLRRRFVLVDAIAARIPRRALERLRRNPRVRLVEVDSRVRALDLELDAAWGVSRIGAGIAHASGNRGEGIKVAVLDTGIDCGHPDLDGNCASGIDFVNDDSDPMDDNGHGTHVAGTIAAEDDDIGVVGVAPRATLYGIKVLDHNGNGSWSDVVAGLEWAVQNGIQVANHSYGASGNPGTIVLDAFQAAEDAGIVHVAAAGNSGNCLGTGDSVEYPARFDSVIAVANTDFDNRRACSSATGALVEIAAPGSAIYSTRVGGGYTTLNGTSMASPHVAGVAALVLAAGRFTSPADVRNQLFVTADDLGAPGRDPHYGFGLVDADEAADVPLNGAPTVAISSPADGAHFDAGESISFEGSASDPEDGDLTASIAWSSSLDGPIGTGGSFLASLSEGVHTVTARVVDSGELEATDAVNVTVTPAEQRLVVSSIEYHTFGQLDPFRSLVIKVNVRDAEGAPVAGATARIRVTREGRGSRIRSVQSDANGEAMTIWWIALAGCYQTEVWHLDAPGLTWDGVTPTNRFCK